jgi:hypothetical protein
MKIGSVIFVAAITVTLLMALTMNLVSAESDAKVRVNPSGQQKVNLEQEQHNVELNFTVPRAIPVERAYNELGYDDGWELSGHAWTCAGSGYAVRFTPPSYPIELLTARINFWPNWPNINHETFAIYVFAGDGRDRQPGTYLGGPVYHTATNWYWNDVDISGLHITIESGDFYILYLQLSGYPDCEALSFDRGQPYYGRSWDYSGGSWSTSQQAYNYMIRCVVKTQENDLVAFRNGWWYVSKEDHTGTDWTKSFKYGILGDRPVIGDIDNNEIDDAVVFRDGWWYVSKEDHTGTDWTKSFKYGITGDKPVIGDIDNNGIVDAVIFRNGWWYVTKDDHTGTDWTKTFKYGITGDKPVIGDIDNNGIVDAVIFRNGWWYVSNEAHTGTDWTKSFAYGVAGDKTVIGYIG